MGRGWRVSPRGLGEPGVKSTTQPITEGPERIRRHKEDHLEIRKEVLGENMTRLGAPLRVWL